MDMGTLTPIAAYVVAVLGSVLGLLSAERARNANRTTRNWWIAVAAVSIGGLGIWGMHFTAMLGTWMGANVSYDIPITLLSMVVAIVVVASRPVPGAAVRRERRHALLAARRPAGSSPDSASPRCTTPAWPRS